jgi:hypothetical protein
MNTTELATIPNIKELPDKFEILCEYPALMVAKHPELDNLMTIIHTLGSRGWRIVQTHDHSSFMTVFEFTKPD